jgi:hypothetical protein
MSRFLCHRLVSEFRKAHLEDEDALLALVAEAAGLFQRNHLRGEEDKCENNTRNKESGCAY